MVVLPRAAALAFVALVPMTMALVACGDDDSGETEDTGSDTGDIPDLPETDFEIELVYQTDVGEAERSAFETARRRWAAVIQNSQGVAQVNLASQSASGCMSNGEGGVVTTSGVAIIVQVAAIDGSGGTLGAAGPCLVRSVTGAPVLGIMTFDSADLRALETAGRLETVILHEMGHVIGFGTLWGLEGLLANPSLPDPDDPNQRPNPGADTHFTGSGARAAFDAATSGQFDGSIVPVDNSAQQGSADGHWRENVLDNELMTPSISGREPSVPMSAITIASLADFGFYDVNEELAEPYQVPALLAPATLAEDSDRLDFGCELIRPTHSVNATGVVYPLRR